MAADQRAAEADAGGPRLQVGRRCRRARCPPSGRMPSSRTARSTVRRYAGPPSEAGNSLTVSTPSERAARISVGVRTPGIGTIERSSAASTTSRCRPGDTMNRAPRSAHARTWSVETTVPAPIVIPASADAFDRFERPGRVEGDFEQPDATGDARWSSVASSSAGSWNRTIAKHGVGSQDRRRAVRGTS